MEAMLAALDRDGAGLVALGVCVRMAAAVAVGTLPLLPGATLRLRGLVAVVLAGAALPAALAAEPAVSAGTPAGLVLAGEAVVGLALGAAVGGVIAAIGWAGGLLGSVCGLSWAEDFDPLSGGESGGVARLCFWVGLAAFFAAGGQLAVVAGLVDGVRTVPVGSAFDAGARPWLLTLAVAMPAAAFELAVLVALPALAAILATHVTTAVCLRTIPFAPGPGLLVAIPAIVLLSLLAWSVEGWAVGAATLVDDTVRRLLAGG